jgi:hypothetical protein
VVPTPRFPPVVSVNLSVPFVEITMLLLAWLYCIFLIQECLDK